MKNRLRSAGVSLIFFCLVSSVSFSQVGIGTNSPAPNSILQLSSTSKGFLPPKMNTTQRATLAAILGGLSVNTTRGMMVIDSSSGRPYYWSGSSWQDFSAFSGTAPINVNLSTNTIALNPGTNAGELMSWNGSSWVNISGSTYVKYGASNMQPFLVLNYCIALQGVYPSQNGLEPFVGEIELVAFNFPPKGFAFCNGQLLPIAQNQALFSLLGTTYGGNGQTTFALPDLRGRVIVHAGTGPGLSNKSLGQVGGTEIVPVQ